MTKTTIRQDWGTLAALFVLIAVLAAAARAQFAPQAPEGDRGPAGAAARRAAPRSPPGWRRVLARAVADFAHDRLLAVAAGVAFYALLALVPAITALVSAYALIADPGTIAQHLMLLAGLVPEEAFTILLDQINRIVQRSGGGLSLAALSGLAVAIWSTNNGVKAVIDALNAIHGLVERRGFLRLTLLSLVFTIGGIVVLIVAIGSIVVMPLLMALLGLEGWSTQVMALLRWPALFVLLLLALVVLYRYGPDRPRPPWHAVLPGALAATLAALAGSALLSWYLARFADYDAVYGSLGAVIGLMMWLWVSGVAALAGAELNAAIAREAGLPDRGSAQAGRASNAMRA